MNATCVTVNFLMWNLFHESSTELVADDAVINFELSRCFLEASKYTTETSGCLS